jgi:serine/threonine protein kinase
MFCILDSHQMRPRLVQQSMRFIQNEDAREKTRIDAIAMERLQGSPRIVDIYAYCGTTIVTEFISGKTMQQVTKRMKSGEKLSLAIQIAQGLADVHTIDGDQPSLAHNDLYEENVLFTPDNRPLIHDFNLGKLIMRDKKTNKTCGGSAIGKDITSLGDILYQTAVGRPPIKMKPNKEGKLPPIPAKIENSSDPAMQTLLKAFKACYRYDLKDRPSAPQVVAFLQNKTSTI